MQYAGTYTKHSLKFVCKTNYQLGTQQKKVSTVFQYSEVKYDEKEGKLYSKENYLQIKKK